MAQVNADLQMETDVFLLQFDKERLFDCIKINLSAAIICSHL